MEKIFFLNFQCQTGSFKEIYRFEWYTWRSKLTNLFHFLANRFSFRFIWRISERINRTFHIGPVFLFIGYFSYVKWIITKRSIWCIWWTPPTFQSRRLQKRKQDLIFRIWRRKHTRKRLLFTTRVKLFDFLLLTLFEWKKRNCSNYYKHRKMSNSPHD